MKASITRDKLKMLLTRAAAAAFWVAVWQLAYLKVAQELLLVSPARAFSHLLFRAGEFSFCYGFGERMSRVWIVARLLGVASEVENIVVV